MAISEINKARELSKRISELERQVTALRLSRDNIVPVLDGMPHATAVKSKVEKLALRLVESERVLESLRAEFETEKARLASAIMDEFGDANEQALLILRYVSCLSFREIAHRMRYSLRHLKRLHDRLVKRSYDATLATPATLDNTGQANIIKLE